MKHNRSFEGQAVLQIKKLGSGPSADVELVLEQTDPRGRHKRLRVSQAKLQRGLLTHQPVAP